jgi:hypothetical protein
MNNPEHCLIVRVERLSMLSNLAYHGDPDGISSSRHAQSDLRVW